MLDASKIPLHESTTLGLQRANAMTRQEIEDQIAQYEQMFGMSSEEFLQRVWERTAPDTFETMDWKILLHYR